MIRTVKRQAAPLAAEPLLALRTLVGASNREKAHWLRQLRGYKGFRFLANVRRTLRDPAVKAGYTSPNGLSVRQWKLALDEAVGMAERFWQGHFVNVRITIARAKLNDAQRHYCFSILRDYQKLYDLFEGRLPALPVVPKSKKMSHDAVQPPLTRPEQIGLVHRLRAAIRRNVPCFPCVKLSRSAVLDQNCYRIGMRDGVQYASVATLQARQRIEIALKGYCATPKSKPRTHKAPKKTDHYGTVRLVVDGNEVTLHTTSDTAKAAQRAARTMTGAALALDAGYTDTFADQHGNFYGTELGRTLLTATDALHDKGVARNKLHAIEKKNRACGKTVKADAMRRCNLGTVKQVAVRKRQQATVDCILNTAINEVLVKKPTTVIREMLSKAFTFELGRKANRRLSAWTRGRIAERCDFKLRVGGSISLLANAAYCSQECSVCGWVEQSNRNGHSFKCRTCGHGMHAGSNAASVLIKRSKDPDISLYTPYGQVKQILLARYQATHNRWLETAALAKAAGTVAPAL